VVGVNTGNQKVFVVLAGWSNQLFDGDLSGRFAEHFHLAAASDWRCHRRADVEVEVGLELVKFANGGSWSFFLCPFCGRKARILKLLEGCVLCWVCCHRRGARYRVWRNGGLRQRAELRIPKLRAQLESSTSLRLKSGLWGTMERRSRLEARLRRAEYIVAQHMARGK
jgi:hypothetical protein